MGRRARRRQRSGGGGGGGLSRRDWRGREPRSHSAFEGPAIQGSGLSTRGGGTWPNYYTAAADVCMWDILGKAVNRPDLQDSRRVALPTKDRLMAYASSQHLPTVEDYVPDVLKAKSAGLQGVQDSSRRRAACDWAGDSHLHRAYGGDSRSAQGGGRRVCADARSRAALQPIRRR